MEVIPIKALEDNYIWLVVKKDHALIVDPGESQPVLDYLNQLEKPLMIDGILITHNHDDHIAGIKGIKERYPDIPVYGPNEVRDDITQFLQGGDQLSLLREEVEVIETPGHSAGHISYLIDNSLLFSGDALFSAGCGRVFTGDYQAQYDSLRRLAKLSNRIKVYGGHEYTETNLKFAVSVEPDNPSLKDELAITREYIRLDKETYPSTIGREKEINLFMRAKSVEEFTELRLLRDKF